MGLLKRIFGICETKPPADAGCWQVTDGQVEVRLSRAPELSAPGGAVRLEGKGLSKRLLVMRVRDGRYLAFHNKCTHFGRRIDTLPGTDQMRCCSVSKSTFDETGRVVSGPAKGPLTAFPVTGEGDTLRIAVS
jgi:nitrite reductase/ring-hydroxylating ferredoxin subunit